MALDNRSITKKNMKILIFHPMFWINNREDATEEEIDYIVRNVGEVVQYLRSFSPVWRDLTSGKTPFIL